MLIKLTYKHLYPCFNNHTIILRQILSDADKVLCGLSISFVIISQGQEGS